MASDVYATLLKHIHTRTQTQNPHTFHSYNHITETKNLPMYGTPLCPKSEYLVYQVSQAAKSPPGQLGADTASIQPGFHLVI